MPTPTTPQLTRHQRSSRPTARRCTIETDGLLLPEPSEREAALDALHRLGRMVTIREVEQSFGTARDLARIVLGAPAAGGHANGPVIRALGEVLHHPLGPAVAADALTLAWAIADRVDTVSIERLLVAARTERDAFRPLNEPEQKQVNALLGELSTTDARRRAMCAVWRPRGDRVPELWIHSDEAAFDLTWPELTCWWSNCWGIEVDPEPERLMADVAAAVRSNATAGLGIPQLRRAAQDPALFGDHAVLSILLRTIPAAVMMNPECPTELIERIRYPGDAASTQLALLAGPGAVDVHRLRRRLVEASRSELGWLASTAPVHLCAALNWLGLLDASWFIGGPLAELDLHDPWIVRSSLRRTGRSDDALWDHPVLVDLQVRAGGRVHPNASWLAGACPPVIEPVLAHQLARNAHGRLEPWAAVLYDWGHTDLLDASDACRVGVMGEPAARRCPGVAAIDRPRRAAQALRRALEPASHGGRFRYPEAIARIDGQPLPGWPGWTVHLPADLRALERNARRMRNCTAGYADVICNGTVVIVLIDGPHGACLNASLVCETGGQWIVNEVNGFGNDGRDHRWAREGLTALLPGGRAGGESEA